MSEIRSIEQLNEVYSQPRDIVRQKVRPTLDTYTTRFIEHSAFALLSSIDSDGFTDISPKGGVPGFIKVADDRTLLIPDGAGNNRVDSLRNILCNPGVGLLFMVNGVNEVVRVKGRASIHRDEELFRLCPDGEKAPKVVIKVCIESVFFHCPKALTVGKLWEDDYRVERSFLPSLAEIVKSQVGSE
ncbi:phosphohydrolase [Marinobacter maroccanus]|uniref:Phosphohydrolase n=1 Tax=Marinobacter maroccanus TaxID=2055143 RepID=A0A2S5Z836_9GAMM|nr:MSMEG_1061 family FMN-dependent PPOX-type flavoprotein [Marinobacter maroccanus]PPI83533.1 phosphohydrolase [Marinobacter maroccanus]